MTKRCIGLSVLVVLKTISEGALKTLFVRRERSLWALPSGEPGYSEPLDDAAARVIREQAGVSVDYLEQLYTFGDSIPAKTLRAVEVAYYGLVPSALLRTDQLTTQHSAGWFGERERLPLAEGHATVVKVALARLRGKLAYTAVGFELLPEKFTLAELQNLYEVILDKVMDKRNFHKKINELGILEPTGEKRSSQRGRGRPAALYRFKPEVFRQIETKGDIFPF